MIELEDKGQAAKMLDMAESVKKALKLYE